MHRIVWESFKGEIPEGYEINHIDGNPENNSLENLEIVSHKENCIKANHGQKEIVVINKTTNEKQLFSSISQASIAIFGDRTHVTSISKAIKNNRIYNGYFWIIKE